MPSRERVRIAPACPAPVRHQVAGPGAERSEQGLVALRRRVGNRRVRQGVAGGRGRPLPDLLRAPMERAFGTDLSAVRVHVDARAGAVGALAFTHGPDIHFGPGEYQPDTPYGQALLGHELAHVVQQRSGRVTAGVDADPGLEREAHETGLRAARGERVDVSGAGPGVGGPGGAGAASIQRTPKWLKNILRAMHLMTPHPAGAVPGAVPAAPADPLDDFVAAYEDARFYHATGHPDNARSIHEHGLLTQADRIRVLGQDVAGMSSIGGHFGEFAGDEKKGVYLGRRQFAEMAEPTLPRFRVRLFLPADRTVVHENEQGYPAHQLRKDERFPGPDSGGLIAARSLPAEHTYYGDMLDLLEAGGDRLDSILTAVGTHYPPGEAPTPQDMERLLREAIRQRRLSNAALDVEGRGARPPALV